MSDSSNSSKDSNQADNNTVGRDLTQNTIQNHYYHNPPPSPPESAPDTHPSESIHPPQVWISPGESPSREALATELRLRGIFVERDSLLSTDHVVEQLNQADGCVIYLTPTMLSGLNTIADELDWVKQNSTKVCWLILENLSRERLHDHPLGKYIPWKHVQIIEISRDPVEQHTMIIQCATRIANHVTTLRYKHHTKDWFDLLLHSYPSPPGSGAHLILDWSDYFGIHGQPLQHQYWAHAERALHDVKTTLSTIGITRLSIIPNGIHLTGAVLCGAVFSNTVRFIRDCRVANIFENKTTWWDTGVVGKWTGIRVHPMYAPHDEDSDISLEWGFYQPVNTINKRNQKFLNSSFAPSLSQRLQMLPEEGDKVIIESERNAMAIAALFRQLVQQPIDGTFHLFGAMPAALAVLFGRQLNACPPVQCYEFGQADDNKQSYVVCA